MSKQGQSRLAVRREGSVIKAYVAQMETMDGALEVASVALAFAEQPGWFDQWVALLAKAHATFITETLGVQVLEQRIESAPAHERSGHA